MHPGDQIPIESHFGQADFANELLSFQLDITISVWAPRKRRPTEPFVVGRGTPAEPMHLVIWIESTSRDIKLARKLYLFANRFSLLRSLPLFARMR
jgi:hypothetical protein